MPRIPDKYLDCVIYLYPSVESARAGEKIGGTGFVVGMRMAEPHRPVEHIYAVTCAHVVAEGNTVIRINNKAGGWETIALDGADWKQELNGKDLAVCRIDLSDAHKYSYVGIGDFLNDRMLREFNVGPGDDVFMSGRFVNHDGRQRNTPTMRFGNIAMMPHEPITGWQNVPQLSFLVDMRSRTAFSGSPVFVYIAPTEIRMGLRYWTQQQASTFYGPWLLGVDWGHIPVYSKVLGKDLDRAGNRLPVDGGWDVETISGMNTVTPAWDLTEFLMDDPDLNAERIQIHETHRDESVAVLDVARKPQEPPTKEGNPDHREDFNSLLDAAIEGKPQDR